MKALRLVRSNPQFLRFLCSRGLYAFAVAALPALLAVSVVSHGGGTSEIAQALGVGAVPAVLGALLTPGILRRITQKRLFGLTCLVWTVTAATTAALELLGLADTRPLVVVSFLLEFVGATLYPAIGSYLPHVVGQEDLRTANAQRSVVVGLAGVTGPVLLATLAALGPHWLAWALVAVLLLAAWASQIGMVPGSRSRGADGGPFADARAGLHFLRNSPGILTIVLYAGVWHLLA